MRFLLDQNLAPVLLRRLVDVYPGSVHVRDVGLASADDAAVWAHAKREGFTILSKDADFRQLSFLHGCPPKVVWLRVGNRSTSEIEAVIRSHSSSLAAFAQDEVAALLVITLA